MDFELTDEQELLGRTARRFLETECPLDTVRELAEHPAGFRPEWWAKAAELGWTSMLIPEAHGGGSVSGRGLRDLAVIVEEAGRMVAPGPVIPTNVVASAVARSGNESLCRAILPGIAAGEKVATWAFYEPQGGWSGGDVGLDARAVDGGYVLEGAKSVVEAAAEADHFLVTARLGDGLAQFVVDSGSDGVTVSRLGSVDLVRRFGEVTFAQTFVSSESMLGRPGEADEDVERQIQETVVLQCAEMVGATGRVFEFTLEWAFDRYSFGRPLASYQALKHRFADMKMWLEACHATATGALRAVQDGEDNAGELVSVAKAYIGDRAPEIIQDCIQMHGGIGITWDHDIHLYLRRVTLERELFGSPAAHRERIAAILQA